MKVSSETWIALVNREDGRCQYCGVEEDLMPCHYVPSSLGGSDTLENLWLGCWECHRQEHDGYLLVTRINGHFFFQKRLN